MITPPPICTLCRHFDDSDGWKCPAFPDGIPEEIANGENPHQEPIRGEFPTFEKAEGVTDEEVDGWLEMNLEYQKVQADIALDL